MPKSYKNIVLIGMPGSGKSTIGVLLAKAIGMAFIDTDLLIQQQENRLLQDIISEQGIAGFLAIEEAVLLKLEVVNTVVATGGSVIYSNKAMEHLKRNNLVVYLHVDYPELEQRITDMDTRGIVMTKGQKLVDVYNERIEYYQKYADLMLDSTGISIEETLRRLVSLLKNKN
ncbi:MAG TPA: shikimate kinase [Bacillota bacterium]|nr:shikimate kinase [Bacillota bacterium]HOL09879.1 shikimate kinase [Bacillota bacterium]HPO97561.1 shikimate kinase [Bacillota bacterium]